MPKRDDGNEVRMFRAPRFGDESKQTSTNTEQPPAKDPVTGGDSGRLPEFGFEDLYDWCPKGLAPGEITGVITRALQLHFSNPDYINDDNLKSYIWTPDQTSKIRIIPNTLFDHTKAGQMPALVIKRGPVGSTRAVIGDRTHNNAADEERGVERYMRLMTGQHAVMCLAEADGAVEVLALEVFNCLTWLGPIFVNKLPFHDFQTVTMSDVQILDQTGSKMAIQIQVQYVYEYGWTTTQHAPKLNFAPIRATPST